MVRISLEFAAVIVVFLAATLSNDPISADLLVAGITLSVPFFVDVVVFVIVNSRMLGVLAGAVIRVRRSEYIRFSMSYQFRIEVDGEFLLVRNEDFGWYQPVGGKYKRLAAADDVFQKLGILPDDKLPSEEKKKHDLAVRVPKYQVHAFLKWFREGRQREVSHFREFYEELLAGENALLSSCVFPYINYRYVDTVMTPLHRSHIDSGWQAWEVLSYDILDLIPNEEQLNALRRLKQETEDNQRRFIWTSRKLIESGGFDKAKQQKVVVLGTHVKWIINGKWSRE